MGSIWGYKTKKVGGPHTSFTKQYMEIQLAYRTLDTWVVVLQEY